LVLNLLKFKKEPTSIKDFSDFLGSTFCAERFRFKHKNMNIKTVLMA